MNIEQQRKAFEAWAYSNKWNVFRVRDMGLDHYVDDFVNGAWYGWLAAQQQEGYVLVPVEPTKTMIRVGEISHTGYDNIDAKEVYKTMLQVAQE